MTIEAIYNCLLLTDNIASSGQPTEEELMFIVDESYEVVINLGLDDAEYTLQNEAAFFKEKQLKYFHIPVLFHAPTADNLLQFFELLEKYQAKKIFLHCAANKRVSVFMALYRIIKLGWGKQNALHEVHLIWQPNELWQAFFNAQVKCFIET